MASEPFEPDSLVLDGRFRIVRRLGTGGMGEVYLAEQVSLQRRVALKALRQDLHLQPGMAERFRREARLLSSVDHPSVVRVIDFGESQGAPFLVMEFVEGESLDVALAREPFPPERAVPLLLQLAEGLAAIHEKGIVHRDLKPDNVILTTGSRGEQARLLDFGIARLAEPDSTSGVTQAGLVLGTPEYVSPEQAMGQALDGRSDLYALGVLAFRLLSGELPFKGPSPRELFSQHATLPAPPLDQVAPRLRDHPALVALVMRCLEKDASRRPGSALELARELAAPGLLRGAPAAEVSAAPAPPPAWGTQRFAPLPPADSDTRTSAPPGPHGTQAFGGPPPSAPAPAGPPAPASGEPPRRSSELPRPTFTGGSLALKAQNLTVLLTGIQGFTERTSRQTREQNARMMREHDRLLLPLFRAFGGRVQQRRGDALLVTFKSPTESVLCAMAIQDALWRHNLLQPELERIPVRTAIHLGEVLVEKDVLIGEPVQVVSAVEEVIEAGEVVLTAAVRLSMTRAEAPTGERGSIELPGRGERLNLYRCLAAAEGPPFGGRDLQVGQTLTRTVEQGGKGLAAVRAAGHRLLGRLPRPGRRELFAAIALTMVGMAAALALVARYDAPPRKARRQLESGQPQAALHTVEAACLTICSPELRSLQATALHRLKKHRDELAILNGLAEAELARVEPLALSGLAEDFGRNERDPAVRALLSRLPAGVYASALASDDCRVRALAARRLGELGEASARPALSRLAAVPKKGDGCGQDEASAALRKLDRP